MGTEQTEHRCSQRPQGSVPDDIVSRGAARCRSDLKLLASEHWERKRYRDLLGGQFLQLRLFEKQPIRTLARELIR